MDAAEIEKKWTRKGFSCGLWTDPPGKRWAEETHDVDQILMLDAGEIEIRIPGRVIKPAVGEEVILPAGTPHAVSNPGKASNHWYYGYKES